MSLHLDSSIFSTGSATLLQFSSPADKCYNVRNKVLKRMRGEENDSNIEVGDI